MKTVKHISLILLITVIAYGVADLKSIAWCCGSCGQMNIQTEHTESCCHDEKSKDEPAGHCKDIPCRVTSFQYDWDVPISSPAVKPVVFTLFAFAPERPDYSTILHAADFLMVDNNSPPDKPLPREYLSFIHVLLI